MDEDDDSRSPHGERGLKCLVAGGAEQAAGSLSAWRAWIEIQVNTITRTCVCGRSPHGERGLKYRLTQSHAHVYAVALRMESVD